MIARTAALVAATLVLAPELALACGGFFCSQQQPIDQSGEAVVFGVGSGQVTMHVQIDYEGPSEEFAWVIPVGGEPDLFLSNRALFDALPDVTQPTFVMQRDTGECAVRRVESSTGYDYEYADADTDSDADADTDTDTDVVVVVDKEVVGAYDTVTLTATSSVALVEWLDENGYDLPAAMDDLLAPYVADGMYFVALKLRKSSVERSGNLEPLALSYPGTEPVIPIQLTAVAATPDMRLNVYIFGDGRAAPTNYLHVRANPLLVDWDNWLFDDSYNQSITVAANEAGGQAFATDYAMPTGPVPDALRPRAYDLALLRSMPTPWDFVNALGAAGFENTPALGQILEGHLPIPEDFPATISDIISCAWCYADDLPDGPFDLDATVDALDADIVMPEQNLYALWNDSRYLTRLRSSVSPEEMTVDPSFHVTDGLVDVPQVRNARMTYLCARSQDHTVPPGKVRFAEYAPRRTVFPGGYETVLPPEVWMQARGLTDRDYLADLFSRSALVVEQIEVTGERVILEDHRARLRRVLGDESWNADAKTCGCTAVSGSAGVFGLPLLLLLATRRRDDLRPAEMDG